MIGTYWSRASGETGASRMMSVQSDFGGLCTTRKHQCQRNLRDILGNVALVTFSTVGNTVIIASIAAMGTATESIMLALEQEGEVVNRTVGDRSSRSGRSAGA